MQKVLKRLYFKVPCKIKKLVLHGKINPAVNPLRFTTGQWKARSFLETSFKALLYFTFILVPPAVAAFPKNTCALTRDNIKGFKSFAYKKSPFCSTIP